MNETYEEKIKRISLATNIGTAYIEYALAARAAIVAAGGMATKTIIEDLLTRKYQIRREMGHELMNFIEYYNVKHQGDPPEIEEYLPLMYWWLWRRAWLFRDDNERDDETIEREIIDLHNRRYAPNKIEFLEI